MCKDLQENKINKMKFHEEIYANRRNQSRKLISIYNKNVRNTKINV